MSKLTTFFKNHFGADKFTENHVYVDFRTKEENIQLHDVRFMMVSADCRNKPQMIIVDRAGRCETTYHFPLCTGFQIHQCNEFLRSLGTDVNIEFVTYKQYNDLIDSVYQIISER